jgi:hypothetical protein
VAAAGLQTPLHAGPAWTSAICAAQDDDTPVVTLVVDFGDGVQKRFTAIPWKEEMTVLDALEHARRHPRGIRFEHRGSGRTAFLLEIDGLRNEGATGRNWIFMVNEKLARQSCGVTVLEAEDTVVWEFRQASGCHLPDGTPAATNLQ